jgi:hypothetical protein
MIEQQENRGVQTIKAQNRLQIRIFNAADVNLLTPHSTIEKNDQDS